MNLRLLTLPLLSLLGLAWSEPTKSADSLTLSQDPILKAMAQECTRALDSLHSPKGQKPYLVRALIRRYIRNTWVASLGELESKHLDTLYEFGLDLRLGNPQMDQTQFPNVSNYISSVPIAFPPTGDPLLIRKAIWAQLDDGFKRALETLPQKMAWLDEHPQIHPPAAWRSHGPELRLEQVKQPTLDSTQISKKLRDLSAHIEADKDALESRSSFEQVHSTIWYFDTQGRKSRQEFLENTLVASVLAQGKDGAPLWDYIRHSSPVANEVLDLNWTLEGDSLNQRIQAIKNLEPLQHYRGPVIYQDAAAQSFWQGILLDLMAKVPITSDITQASHPFVSLVGRRILPKEIDIRIDNSLNSWNHHALYGNFKWDEEGSTSQSADLVHQGRLMTLPKTMSPYTGESPDSSLYGHFRYGQFSPGITWITTSKGLNPQQFQKVTDSLCQDEGISEILVIKKVYDADAIALLHHPLMAQAYEPNQMELWNPVTGARHPVRGLTLPNYTIKDLRSLMSFSAESTLGDNHGVSSLIYPRQMIFGLDDIQPRNENPPKLLLP